MAKIEVPICQNPRCGKPMLRKRRDAKFCSAHCRNEARQIKLAELPDLWVCQACHYPKQPQAEIVMTEDVLRHPYNGKRPEYSGWCVVKGCQCETCRPENLPQEWVEAREEALV